MIRVIALVLVAGVVVGSASRADARPLEAVSSSKKKIRVDGLLREWPAKLDRLNTTVRGSTGKGDPRASGVIGYDAKNLFVAMKVTDGKLVRTRAFGRAEDHAEIIIAFPVGRGYRAYSLLLYAGETGKSKGAVKLKGAGKVRGAKIVEAPTDGGYFLEASVPWSTFREAKTVRAGMRAVMRYHDADSRGGVRAVIATSKATRGASMPPLLLEGETGLFHALIYDKSLPERPAKTAVGDLSGNSMKEVVSIYGEYLTIVGSHYRGGKEFFFQDLAVGSAKNVKRFELRDLTGDGKDEIVLQKRVSVEGSKREVLQIMSISKGSDAPFVAFQHEVGIETDDGKISNEVTIGKRSITIAQGKHDGIEPDEYEEPLPGNMDSALLPWSSVKSRTFKWDGKAFEKDDEEKWEPKMDPPSRTTTGTPRRSAAPSGPPPPPPPRPPSADEMMDRVYALYRKDRRVGRKKPRFDFVTDVASDTTSERVLIHKKDIVVFGAGFKGGTSYVYITIGVEEPKDVLDATARDLTGDGKAEIIVRGVLRAKASEELGGDEVTRHALFVYKATEGGIKRIFAAETGRSLGSDSVLGGVRFIPASKGVAIELRSGRAVGWTERNYPFPIDRHPYGGLEPLLIPWGGTEPRQYRFDGGAFSQR